MINDLHCEKCVFRYTVIDIFFFLFASAIIAQEKKQRHSLGGTTWLTVRVFPRRIGESIRLDETRCNDKGKERERDRQKNERRRNSIFEYMMKDTLDD